MKAKSIRLAWKCAVGSFSLGLSIGSAGAEEHPWFQGAWPRYTSQAAIDSVRRPLAQQARNGYILDMTLWNFHFQEGKAELHSSGQYFLDRLARRPPGQPVEIFLQTTRDLSYHPSLKGKFQVYRQGLDAQRIKAVAEYLAEVHPGLAYTLYLHDPAPAGMAGIEAARAVREHREAARGVLPPELLQALGTYIRPGGTGDLGGMPTPVTPGTGLGPGTFGAEAPTGEPPLPGPPPGFPSGPPSGPPLGMPPGPPPGPPPG